MKKLATIILLFNLIVSYSQDFIMKSETGRFINVSLTNYEVRAIELNETQITLESLNGVKLSFKIVERNKDIIKVQLDNQIRFFILKNKKIIVYQRTNYSEATIDSYRKGNHTSKNEFKKVPI